ncbi:MAG: RNA-binding protein [Rhodospirillaceae bacterium]
MLAARRIDMPDEDAEAEHTPLRRCIVTGRSLPVSSLIRFVVSPDRAVVPDVDHALPGRGLWLSAERAMIEKAASKRMFAKAARGDVSVDADLARRVEDLLKRRCLNHLGLARRAGLVAAGADKAKAQISSGRTAALLEASDGSSRERSKFVAMAPHVPVVDVFTGEELGSALGRDAVVHVALLQGRLTTMLLEDAARYRGMMVCTKNEAD